MEKTTRIWDKELNFVRRYCHNDSFPASDQRCPYAKAKIRAGLARVSKINGEIAEEDAMFLPWTMFDSCMFLCTAQFAAEPGPCFSPFDVKRPFKPVLSSNPGWVCLFGSATNIVCVSIIHAVPPSARSPWRFRAGSVRFPIRDRAAGGSLSTEPGGPVLQVGQS